MKSKMHVSLMLFALYSTLKHFIFSKCMESSFGEDLRKNRLV